MQNTEEKTPLPEIIIGGVGLLLVLSVISYFIYAALQPQRPPQFFIETVKTIKQPHGYLTEIALYNKGGETAADVLVIGRILSEDSSATLETTQVLFPFSPPDSTRKAGLIFQHNPLQNTLELQIKSYTAP